MEEKNQVSTKGWNWGYYKLEKDHLAFNVNNQKGFILNYKDIAISNASGKNEVALEFQHDASDPSKKYDFANK
jgi:structure-specific recognition protein 1